MRLKEFSLRGLRYSVRDSRRINRGRLTCLKYATDVKSSPFYRDAVSDLSRRNGCIVSNATFIVGTYQWCFSDQDVPEESDDNLDEFCAQWDHRKVSEPVFTRLDLDECDISESLYSIESFRYLMNPDNRPYRFIPAVKFGHCEPNLSIIGWGRVEPLFHHADDDRVPEYSRRLCETAGDLSDGGVYPLMKFDSSVAMGGRPTFWDDSLQTHPPLPGEWLRVGYVEYLQ